MRPLHEEFRSRATVRGGIVMYHPRDAMALVMRARERGRPILGIDAFIVSAQGTEPHMEHSTDYSRIEGTDEPSWERALRFLQDRLESPFLFEIVLDD